jgi:hypothetical protein
MYRRSRTGEIVDLIDLEQDRFGYVVADQLESMVVEQVIDVYLAAGKEIIKADNIVAVSQQPLAKMRADKARTTGN